MIHSIFNLFDIANDDDLQNNLRLALMFKPEVDEATQAYMEMLQISIDPHTQTAEEISQITQQAINAALITGIRAYRGFLQAQGVDVAQIESNSDRDIPQNFFHTSARWPL